jgi:anti-sigma regulatory factor (Ser/Thr protein kinase)
MASESHWQYSALVTAPGAARRHLESFLEQHGERPLVPVATLLVSELVTNSLLHAAAPICVHARLVGPMLRVEVDDAGNGIPKPRDPFLNGRGFPIVAELSNDWGVALHDQRGGQTTWFELGSTRRHTF